MHLLDELRGTGNVIAVELRAPRAELAAYDFLEADRELVARMARGEIV